MTNPAKWTPGYSLEVGDVVMMQWPRSRWAILWDRVRRPLTEPERTEWRRAEVIAKSSADGERVRESEG
jgi:hypothetical protein